MWIAALVAPPAIFCVSQSAIPLSTGRCVVASVLYQATVCPTLTVAVDGENELDPILPRMSIVMSAPTGPAGFDLPLHERPRRQTPRVNTTRSAPPHIRLAIYGLLTNG